METKQWAGSQSITKYFAGETQTPSVGQVGLASVMFPAMLTVVTSKQLPADQGCLSLPPWYISKISQLSTLRQMHYMERYWSGKVTLFNVHGSGASLSTPVMCKGASSCWLPRPREYRFRGCRCDYDNHTATLVSLFNQIIWFAEINFQPESNLLLSEFRSDNRWFSFWVGLR